jgi:hypothetical protein
MLEAFIPQLLLRLPYSFPQLFDDLVSRAQATLTADQKSKAALVTNR